MEKQPGDGRRLFRTDLIDGVPVHRCWHFVPQRPIALKRILHEGSFVITSLLRLLALPKPDVFVIVSPPLLLGAAATLLGWIKRTPFVFHVQDLQPDAAFGLGLLKPGPLTKWFYLIEATAYRSAWRVSGISDAMLAAFKQKGVPENKVVYFPNWTALPAENELPPRGRFRHRFGFDEKDFLAVYSGNFGAKQGLEILIEAARLSRNPHLRIVLSGDGAQRQSLEARVRLANLANIKVLDLQPEQQYLEMLMDADLSLVTQQAGTGAFFFPSKVLRNLALAKPILVVADHESELTRAVNAGGFGRSISPGRPELVAEVLDALAENPLALLKFGKAGRKFVEQFESNRVLSRFEALLAKAKRDS